jgi:Domain of unknown function (DUF4263)
VGALVLFELVVAELVEALDDAGGGEVLLDDPARSLGCVGELGVVAVDGRPVVRRVVESGLTIEDVGRWKDLADGRLDQLRALAGSSAGEGSPATLEQVVGVLEGIEGLDADTVDALAALLGAEKADEREARLELLDKLLQLSLADDEESQNAFLRSNRNFLAAILQASVDAPDIVALAHRREVLVTFERLLSDKGYFDGEMKRLKVTREGVWQRLLEESPWLIGSTLAPQFLRSWSKDRLEQTVVGSSVAGPGKRPDALLRTAGAISAVVFSEIKHHRTQLLKAEYRPDSWSVSDELAGGVAQCQATVDEAQALLGKSIDVKDEDGYVTGQAFLCRPRSLLVIGSLTEFTKGGAVHKGRFESFERFRRSLRDPEILTFDELFERARLTLELDTAVQAS